MNLGLVDSRLITALLHNRVLWVVRVTGGDAHQRVTWGGGLPAALFSHLLDMIIVSEGDHLRRKEDGRVYQ